MMKNIIFTTILFAIFLPCYAGTDDIKLEECMKNQGYTTYAMISCTKMRTFDYKQESSYLLLELQNKLCNNDYKQINKNQNYLKKYENSLNKTASKIMYSYNGTIYQTMEANFLYNLHKDNVEILKYLKTGEVENTKTTDCSNINNSYFKILPQNDYKKMITNQKEWNKYFKNTKNTIFSVFEKLYPQNSNDAKNVFTNKLISSRENVIKSVILPYK